MKYLAKVEAMPKDMSGLKRGTDYGWRCATYIFTNKGEKLGDGLSKNN